MKNHPLTGAYYLLQGFKLLTRPELRLFVLIPLLINSLLFMALFAIGQHFFVQLIHAIDRYLPSWLAWLHWLLWFVFSLSFLIVTTYTFSLIANLISAPFNSVLAERVELYLTGQRPPSNTSWLAILATFPQGLWRQCRYISYYLSRALILLMLTLIPVIHIVAMLAWFLFTAWTLAMQYLDYPMDNHHRSFSQLRQNMQQKRLTSLSFGVTIMLLTAMPFLNLIIIPTAVIGATSFWLAEFRTEPH